MILSEREILIGRGAGRSSLLHHVRDAVRRELAEDEIPIRLAVTRTDNDGYHCELGILSHAGSFARTPVQSIFDFRRRPIENTDRFNAVLLIPTGIGAELGGHSGDGGAVARLLGGLCDRLILHPNVVNAADINEMPPNALYVEGSVISRMLMGTVGLQPVRSNRVLVVIEEHADTFITEATINAVSAARAAMGLDCPAVVMLPHNVRMRSLYARSGRAAGRVDRFDALCEALDQHRRQIDAVAISSIIEVPEHFHADYFRDDMPDMVNPWGGVEAMLTHAVSLLFDLPSAHSPMVDSKDVLDLSVGVVDPRKSAEAVSTTYLHSILKGLHKSPRIVPDPPSHGHGGLVTAADVACIVIPDGCVGLPTLAAMQQGISVIAVKENRNKMRNDLRALPSAPGKLFIVENYLEAAGVMAALKSGVAVDAVRRPIKKTLVVAHAPAAAGARDDPKMPPPAGTAPINQTAPCGMETPNND